MGNTPIRLEVSKIKEKGRTVTYCTRTRVEGSETELTAKYGKDNLEFAYKGGTYLNYAWYKGTAEYLESRKQAGDEVVPVCEDGVFAGYGRITRPLDTAGDKNRYVSGAKMILYDGIEIQSNGDSGDYGFDGVEVVRDRNNNVKSIKVLEGYAGNTVEFVNSDDIEAVSYTHLDVYKRQGLYKSWKSYRRYSDRGKNCHVFRVQRPSGIQGLSLIHI